jgi:mannose-1-phosphate guanylyltransferase/mannose-6-phosphate isomerase
MNMIPVILSGGSGSRLWPVSRQSFPKQFCELLDESLFSKTLKRLMPLGSPWTVTTRELKVLTERALKDAAVPTEQVIYEPFGKNTAPAIALLCRVFESKGWEEEVVGIFPADHLIDNEEAFHQAVKEGVLLAKQGEIVTLGVAPTSPATGYGYIETVGSGNALKAVGFREKPNESTAREFLAKGGFFWNAGMFIFKVSKMVELLKTHVPDVWNSIAGTRDDLSNLAESYDSVRNISIDYAVMERLSSHVCIPCRFDWSDLGSWDAIAEVFETRGDHKANTLSVDSENNFVLPSGEKSYAFVGVDDLLVIDTADALLVAKRGHSERVKEVVDGLKKKSAASAIVAAQHIFEVRPWGSFEILRDAEHFKSKTVTVDPGAQLSYQSHAKRAEHWIIVSGRGEVVLDGETIPVGPGKHIHIPQGAKHRIRNNGTELLEFVEVQLGSYFGEDDIVRYEDVYGRG